MNKKTLTLHSKFLSYLCSNTAYYTSNVMQLYNIVMLHLTMYKVTHVYAITSHLAVFVEPAFSPGPAVYCA